MEPFDAETFIRAVAPSIGLELTPPEVTAVAEQFNRIHGFAEPVLAFGLQPKDEHVLRFEP
ncbi:MAG: DUF4089 domain-containing protein [Burkholderiales bacterium]|nr:DUF4089 domain-containing protein [Burkholderiales bacterium]